MREDIFDATPSSLDRPQFQEHYEKMRANYERLGINVVASLNQFFVDEDINALEVKYRTKAFDAACEKYDRKHYDNTEEIEDLCGVRVICYYPSDVGRIAAVLKREFDVQGEEDTAQRLAPHEFGYRSTHFILKIKESWLGAPNYRALGTIRFEVQVRTVLMHAWAEIQHKLAYKNSAQVPDQFHRKLYRLSAKFEEADEQFEEIREGLKNYREEVRKEASTDSQTLIGHGLNLDTLQAFLDATFPRRLRSLKQTAQLLSDLNANKLNMSHVVESANACISFLTIVEKISIAENLRQNHSSVIEFYSQCEAMRKCLDITNQKFYDARAKVLSKYDSWVKSTTEGKRLLEAASPPKKRSTKFTEKKRELKAKQVSYDGPMPPYIHKYPVNASTISGETSPHLLEAATTPKL